MANIWWIKNIKAKEVTHIQYYGNYSSIGMMLGQHRKYTQKSLAQNVGLQRRINVGPTFQNLYNIAFLMPTLAQYKHAIWVVMYRVDIIPACLYFSVYW
jgi:hypothetical protein